MFALFFRDADGNFNIARLIFSLIGLLISCGMALWFLPRAVRTGRMPFGVGFGGSQIYYIHRERNPIGFWLLFILYSLMIPLGFLMAHDGWTGAGNVK